MLFTSAEFVFFAVAFFACYRLVPPGGRKLVLLGASYLFYASFNPKFLLLLIGAIVIDFAVARLIHRTQDPFARRALLIGSLSINFGVLVVFKYYGFFIESVAAALEQLGFHSSLPILHFLVPAGISFYTFQTVSYTIDVYRRRLEPASSLLDFALYIAFFPQLVAGPIERAAHLLPQLSGIHERSIRPDYSGLALIALGVFKKAVLGDNLALLVDATFADPQSTHAPALWIGVYAFAIQIYCDFSGYSDIAAGLARLLGIELMQNFRAPYAADGPAEFWRRWHISLSTWFMDYLYIPLGGNRVGTARAYFNITVVLMLMFLWHGAAWHFVLCGVYVSAIMVFFRLPWIVQLGSRLDASGPVLAGVTRALRRLGCFHVFALGFALFRAQSLSDCATIFSKLFAFPSWDLSAWLQAVARSGEGPVLAWAGACMFAVFLAHNLFPHGSFELIGRLWRLPVAIRLAFVSALVYLGAVLGPAQGPPFVYFAF